MIIFAKGTIIGFMIAAVVGPIGLLCIRRGLSHGFVVGFATGLGAAVADVCYGAVAAFGLSSVSQFLFQYTKPLSIIGGCYLVYLGLTTFSRIPFDTSHEELEAVGLLHAFASTFLLALTSPVTILAFLSIFGSFGLLQAVPSGYGSLLLVSGVFLGSCTWWLLLSSGVSILRTRLTLQVLRYINQASGIALVIFGIMAMVR